jgi:hypothetical protein
MRRWISRALPALILCITLPAAAGAQTPAPATPPVTPPAAPTLPAATPAVPPTTGTVVVMPNGVIYIDPYHAASPYNPAVVNQAVPSPALNRPVTTLPCVTANQNLDPYVPAKPACGNRWFQKKSGCSSCGHDCAGDNQAPCGQGPQSCLGKVTHPYCGIASKGGAYTTCAESSNFIFASSRSFFGESSREFFERPPAPDGIKMVPKAYCPVPAPGAYMPAYVVVNTP